MAILFLTRSILIIGIIAAPVLPIGAILGPIINRIFPPTGGGWFEGMQGILIADLILAWLWIWFLLFVFLKLYLRFIYRKRETA